MVDPLELRDSVLAFVEHHRLPEDGPGAYHYSLETSRPTLYSSAYAAMTLSLCGAIDPLPADEREAWSALLNRHQDEDGLYRDPVIFGEGWYRDDPLWCGRPHLTCHVVTALTALGSAAPREIAWLDPFRDCDRLRQWLNTRDFGPRVAWSGNEIMNIGTLLQYARDIHNDSQAGQAVNALLDWLDTHHLNPATGVWGSGDMTDPLQRSHAVQAAYHWWPVYAYDRRPFPCLERAVDTVLATQNALGGFGWGCHGGDAPDGRFLSSACEDIDSIDPLVRMSRVTDYRRADVYAALHRAYEWVLTNRTSDGGFVFLREKPFEYGHPELRGRADQGAMFPTWFRLLSLALIGKALPDHPLHRVPWHFVRCPGYQFW